MSSKYLGILSAVLALSLVAAACGDDDEGAEAPAPAAPAEPEPEETGEMGSDDGADEMPTTAMEELGTVCPMVVDGDDMGEDPSPCRGGSGRWLRLLWPQRRSPSTATLVAAVQVTITIATAVMVNDATVITADWLML